MPPEAEKQQFLHGRVVAKVAPNGVLAYFVAIPCCASVATLGWSRGRVRIQIRAPCDVERQSTVAGVNTGHSRSVERTRAMNGVMKESVAGGVWKERSSGEEG